MDLSMMTSLRSIKCPAECLLVPGSPYSVRVGLYKLLPRVLEELIVSAGYVLDTSPVF
jgi:hypothetical protein